MNPRETNLKLINEAVAKVSDTMALTFGCRLKRVLYRGKVVEGSIVTINTPEDESEPVYILNSKYIGYENNSGEFPDSKTPIKDFEILGREAQLHEILLAIGKSDYYVNTDGIFSKKNPEWHTLSGAYCKWNLKGGIEHQTDEVLQFIAELLK